MTDYLNLTNHKFLEKARRALPKEINNAKNVLTLKNGVLYMWNFQDLCVLTLNLNENGGGDNGVTPYQILLPTSPSRFAVNLLRVNSLNTLLIVAGSDGILVFELPEKSSRNGHFVNNKEIVYCRSHRLDDRLLLNDSDVKVRQVRFHPASIYNNHILVLMSDNVLRLYKIEKGSPSALKVYILGQRPKGVLPGSKVFFLELFGETAVDFDFGTPELPMDQPKPTVQNGKMNIIQKLELLKINNADKYKDLVWPIYFLNGLGMVFVMMINLNDKSIPKVIGPIPVFPLSDRYYISDACAILCQPCSPPILCIAYNNGTISHSIILPMNSDNDKLKKLCTNPKLYGEPDRAMYHFETLELDLGYINGNTLSDSIFLHMNESRQGHYFATHQAGVHSITIPAVDALSQIVNGNSDQHFMEHLLNQNSSMEYLVCTKNTSSTINPVIGFSLYYDPTSTVTLLAQGQIISTLLVLYSSMSCSGDNPMENVGNPNSPLGDSQKNPFDIYIYKLLKRPSSQPLLKLSQGGKHTYQEYYELLQRASNILREERFKYHNKAREEIEKRMKALKMLQNYQRSEISKLAQTKHSLQRKAEYLAEKYEDIKEKHDKLTKRCERLLLLLSQKKTKPSDADIKFMESLKESNIKVGKFLDSINTIKNQSKYQEMKVENWRRQQLKNETGFASLSFDSVKDNLEDIGNQINNMVDEVDADKKKLGLRF